MTYRDLIIMRNNLDLVNTIEGTNPKFLYAVSRNKARLDTIIKTLDSLKKPSETIEDFWRKLDEINKKHAETDDSGTVQYTTISLDGQTKKAYKKVIGEGNPTSKYTKEVNELKKKFQDDIDKYEANIKNYNKMLDEEVPEGDYRIFWIDFEIIPAGLNPRAMDGCLPFTKEVEQSEDKPSDEDKKELKKEKSK
jgi:hypothetical protein